MASLVLALACVPLSCGGSGGGGSSQGIGPGSQLRGSFSGETVGGALDAAIASGIAREDDAFRASFMVTGVAVLPDQSQATLIGTFDDQTGELVLEGGGYTFTGTLAGGIVSGTFTGPMGGGEFMLLENGGGLEVYCGTFSGQATGVWNVVADPGGGPASGSFSTDDGVTHGVFDSGSVAAGGALELASSAADVTASGTIAGDVASGTWLFEGAGGGPWSGTRCSPGAGGGSESDGSATGDGSSGGGSDSGESGGSSETGADLCGNGMVDPGEDCDDMNGIDGDGCNVDCVTSGSEQWTLTINGAANGHDCATGVAIGPADEILVSGNETTLAQGSDAWLGKFLPDGTEVWVQRHNGAFNQQDTGRGVAVDSQGNAILVGSENVAMFVNDILAIKYDPDGNVLWTDLYDGGNFDNDNGFGAAVDGNDDVLVAGVVRVAPSNDQALLRKLDAAGNEVWAVVYDGPVANSWDQNYDVAADATGAIVVAGHATTAINDLDARIAGYDGDGNEAWGNFLAAVMANDSALGVAMDDAGNVAATGSTYDPLQASNIFVRKLDPGGNELWTQSFDGESSFDDVGAGVTFDSAGNIAVIGYESFGGERRIWVRKYDPAGVELWSATYDSVAAGTDAGNGIAADSQGYLVAVGCEVTDTQGQDIWIRRYAP